MDYLAKRNTHHLDSHIIFDEGPHIYTIDGDSDYLSVTKWNHSHFSDFDADSIIDKMMKSYKWSESKYYGLTREEIKNEWSESGKNASAAGTLMHYDIECFYNKVDVDDVRKESIEYKYFQQFTKDYDYLIPYRTEWMIYDKELKLAGSVDMLFQNPHDNTLEIYDWKRSKEIKYTNSWQSGLTKCVSHIPDCNYYHYCLQLNTYKAILERNYNVKISGMYLVCLHPNNNNESYQRIKVQDMADEIKDLFALRCRMLNNEIISDNIDDDCDNDNKNKTNEWDVWAGNSSSE
jgi:hypothetical protein